MSLQGEIVEVLGFNAVIGTTIEDLTAKDADNAYLTGLTEVTLDIKSGSVNDASAGTGAQTARLYYLDSNWARKTVDITLNGTTKVDVDASDIYRVNKLEVTRVGTGLVNAGDLLLTENGGTTYEYLTVFAGENVSRCGYYYVPARHKLAITGISIAAHKTNAKICTIFLYRQVLYGSDYVEHAIEVHTSETTTPYAACINHGQPIIVGPKCRMRLRAVAQAASSLVGAIAHGVLMNESQFVTA